MPTFTAPVVMGLEFMGEIHDNGVPSGTSLMSYFYYPHGRQERLAPLAGPLSHVVLLEESGWRVVNTPELFFEGVRVLGCHARAAGAEPIVLMPWHDGSGFSEGYQTARLGEFTYRVATAPARVWPRPVRLRVARKDACRCCLALRIGHE